MTHPRPGVDRSEDDDVETARRVGEDRVGVDVDERDNTRER